MERPALTPEQAGRVYDRIGRLQDWQRFYESPAIADLVSHADFEHAGAVYELGCGTGATAAALLDGYGDGTPPLATAELDAWEQVLRAEYQRSAPSEDDVLRHYAWSNRAEFFAVASEAFFTTPVRLREAKPDLYTQLTRFYRQDPAARASPAD